MNKKRDFFKNFIISFICFLPFGTLTLLNKEIHMPFIATFLNQLLWVWISIILPIRLGFLYPDLPWLMGLSILIPFYIWWGIVIISAIIQDMNTGGTDLSSIGLVPFINIIYSGWIFGMVYIGKIFKFFQNKSLNSNCERSNNGTK
jgi:hypothetical protein